MSSKHLRKFGTLSKKSHALSSQEFRKERSLSTLGTMDSLTEKKTKFNEIVSVIKVNSLKEFNFQNSFRREESYPRSRICYTEEDEVPRAERTYVGDPDKDKCFSCSVF